MDQRGKAEVEAVIGKLSPLLDVRMPSLLDTQPFNSSSFPSSAGSPALAADAYDHENDLEANLVSSTSRVPNPSEGGLEEDELLQGSDDGDSSSVSSASSSGERRPWDETYRFRKSFRGLPTLDTLDVMRESARVLRRQSDLLTTLAAAFIVPVSVLVLTHVLVTRLAIAWVEKRLETLLFDESMMGMVVAVKSPAAQFALLKFAECLLTSALGVPVALTLATMSKAGIVYSVASNYAGVKVFFMDVIHRVGPRVWLPLVVTYAASCSVVLGAGGGALLSLRILNGTIAAFYASSASTILSVWAILFLVSFGGFVCLKAVASVATVICVLEDKRGFVALARSFSILRGRFQVACGAYVVTLLCAGFLSLLFKLRVTDQNAYTEYNSSGAWEGPLLVLMHSFVYLFEDVMTTVIYFSCRGSSSSKGMDTSRVPESAGSLVGMSTL